MTRYTVTAAVTAVFLAAPTALGQERQKDEAAAISLTAAGEQHERLQRLVGDWSTTAVLRLGPEQPTQRSEGMERVTSIGNLWIRAESSGSDAGERYYGVLTLGYDPRKELYVGTYVDDRCNYLWVYEGVMNEDGTVLTLETEGPVLGAPGRTAKFREDLYLTGEKERSRASYIQVEGEWKPYARVTYMVDGAG